MDSQKINQQFRSSHPLDIVRWAVDQAVLRGGPVIVSTNFRPLEAVILDLCVRAKPDMAVLWADSGYMLEETYRLADKVEKQLKLNLKIFNPLMTAARRDALFGPVPLLPENPTPEEDAAVHAFSEQVKLEPFRRGLAELKPAVWITGLRREQNPFRQTLDIISDENGLLKVNPVFEWSEAQMEAYLKERGLPDEKRYFDAAKANEKRECGLHKPGFLK